MTFKVSYDDSNYCWLENTETGEKVDITYIRECADKIVEGINQLMVCLDASLQESMQELEKALGIIQKETEKTKPKEHFWVNAQKRKHKWR